ncbi:MAG: hypothetical protein WBA12_13280, partial [Catalinimonas sp.]
MNAPRLLPKLLPLLLLPALLCAQDVAPPTGGFRADSVRVGELIDFTLNYRHAVDQPVLFPDSTYDFAPFEYVRRTYFPTRSDTTGSLDSAVYTLRTFELAPRQSLRLPVWELRGGDSLALYTQASTVTLVPVVPPLSAADSVQLEVNTAFAPVEKRFNYPYWLVGGGLLLAVAVAVALFFGTSLRRQYQLYPLRRRQQRFEREWAARVDAWQREPSPQRTEG